MFPVPDIGYSGSKIARGAWSSVIDDPPPKSLRPVNHTVLLPNHNIVSNGPIQHLAGCRTDQSNLSSRLIEAARKIDPDDCLLFG
jgi:hypothetical protein